MSYAILIVTDDDLFDHCSQVIEKDAAQAFVVWKIFV